MASEAYELLALFMRYVFVLIGLLVLLRAFRWMRRDARNYRREMRALPDAGLVGEIVDLRTGKSQPLPREGDMGASRECDIHVKGQGVMRHHLRFAFEEGKGVLITPTRRGRTLLGGRELRSPGYALHGTQLQLGQATLRVRLFAGLKVPQPVPYQEDAAAPDPALIASQPEAADSVFPAGPDLPSPFEFPDLAAREAEEAAPWPGAAPAAPVPAPDYEGHYTDDGQMTWQYAYSLEDLYRAQAAAARPENPADEPETDGAVPYQSPVSRRRRRNRE